MTFGKKLVSEALTFALLGLALGAYPAAAQDEFGYGDAVWFGDKIRVTGVQ